MRCPFVTTCRIPSRPESVTTIAAESDARDLGVPPESVARIWRAVEALYRSGIHPAIQLCVRRFGAVLIERSDAPAALAAIRELGGRVRRGEASAVIFPEGTRARHGTLGTFKRAGMLALLDEAPDAPVLPVVIDESWRLFRHNCLPVPWGVRVYVRLGPPIARQPGEDRAALLDRVHDEMAALLAARRGEPATSRPEKRPVAVASRG